MFKVISQERERRENCEGFPQHPEETVEAVTLVPHERVQQRTAEEIEDLPQHPEEIVEAVTLVPQERVQQRTAEIGEVPETASQDQRLHRTVEQAFMDRAGLKNCRGGIGVGCALRSVCSPRSTKLHVLGSGEGSIELPHSPGHAVPGNA